MELLPMQSPPHLDQDACHLALQVLELSSVVIITNLLNYFMLVCMPKKLNVYSWY